MMGCRVKPGHDVDSVPADAPVRKRSLRLLQAMTKENVYGSAHDQFNNQGGKTWRSVSSR
jgi:hypothetical protein